VTLTLYEQVQTRLLRLSKTVTRRSGSISVMRLQTSIVVGALTLCSAIACGQPSGAELPRYDLTVRLQPGAPRVAGEAIVTVPAPDTGHVSFVLGEMFNVEAVDLRVNNEFRRSRTDTAYLEGLRREWGYIRWRLLDDDPSRGANQGPLTFRVRYRLDTAATAMVFGIDDAVTFASGINTSWYPQIEDGRSLSAGRVRVKRGTGTMRFEAPEHTIVHAIGAPKVGNGGGRYVYDVKEPAYFNFAAGRFHVREQRPAGDEPPALTYYLTPRDSAGTYARKSVDVLRALSAEFGPYPFDRFAIIEIPTDLAQRAGFAGASVDGAILSTSEYLERPFNSAYYGHEIGHQWWGVAIRPTGARGAWMLQEGMAQYGGLRAVEAIDGPQAAHGFRQREYPNYFGQGGELYFRIASEGHDAPLADLPMTEAWSRDIVDSKGFMAMNALSNEIGRERLRTAFREILREFGPRRLLWNDFVAEITKAAGRDLSWFFDQWFYRTGAPDITADLDSSARQVRVRQRGDLYRLTLDLAFLGAGCSARTRVTVATAEERIPFPSGCQPDSVVVDPDYQVIRWTPELRQRYQARR
jgi:hypothetical protein